MGNKHQIHHNSHHNLHQGNGIKPRDNSPMQRQPGDPQRIEASDQQQPRGVDVRAVGEHTSKQARATSDQTRAVETYAKSALRMMNDNPIPTALIGVGLGAGITWLIMSNQAPKGSAASRFAAGVMKRSGIRARELERTLEGLMPTTPQAIGAALLTVAAFVTLAVSGTRREESWLTKGREQLLEMAQGLVHDAVEKVEAIATQLNESAAKAVGISA